MFYVLTRVCPSVCPRGGYPTWSGEYPSQVQPGGYPSHVQTERVSQPGPTGGRYPSQVQMGGYPCQVQMGGIPPPGMGHPPAGGPPWYRTTDGVLDTPRSVCLLRSRRRTLLFHFFSGASANYLDDATCVNPEFRTAKCTLSCGGGWRDSRNNSVMAEAVQGFAQKLHQYGTGVYFNEPDYNLENWKVSLYF